MFRGRQQKQVPNIFHLNRKENVIQEGQEDDGLKFEDWTGLQVQPLQMMMMMMIKRNYIGML
jgi:hypothetical protein